MLKNRDSTLQGRAESKGKQIDAGLRDYMKNIYAKMSLGVLVTALVAWFVSTSPLLLTLFLGGPQVYIVMFAPLAILWFGFRPDRMSSKKLMMAFFALATVYGISFSAIAVVAANDPMFGVAVAKAFFIATSMFAGLSIFGYTSKADFSGMQTFLVMGIWGIVAASIIGLFFHSTLYDNLLAGAGIILFSGLTVWQTQAMKMMYSPSYPQEMNERMGWAAALNLYIAFIAMFQYILHFMNQR